MLPVMMVARNLQKKLIRNVNHYMTATQQFNLMEATIVKVIWDIQKVS